MLFSPRIAASTTHEALREIHNIYTMSLLDPAMIQSLDNSMCRLVSYIQEDQDEFESRGGDDDDIQNLAEALSNKLSVTDAM